MSYEASGQQIMMQQSEIGEIDDVVPMRSEYSLDKTDKKSFADFYGEDSDSDSENEIEVSQDDANKDDLSKIHTSDRPSNESVTTDKVGASHGMYSKFEAQLACRDMTNMLASFSLENDEDEEHGEKDIKRSPVKGNKKSKTKKKQHKKENIVVRADQSIDVCSFCKSKGQMKTCSRCQIAKYCNAGCQKKHFKDHKDICKQKARESRFKEVISKQCMYIMRDQEGNFSYPCSFSDVDDDESSLLTSSPLLAEIVGPIFHPFRRGIEIMDASGATSVMFFYTIEDEFTVSQKHGPQLGPKKYRKGKTIPLSECLQPGNFVVVYLPLWHHFMDGQKGFRIDEYEEVDFLFPF